MRTRARFLLAAACGAAVSCTDAALPVTLAVEGRSNEGVTIAARAQFVAAVWSAANSQGTDIYSAVSSNGGTTFSAPVRVNSEPGDARAGGEQPPQVVLAGAGASPAITVVWTAKRPEGSRLLSAQSTDGGRTFGSTVVLKASEAAGNRGWESVATDSAGHVMVAWLDHRNSAPAAGAMHHQHESAPAARDSSALKPKQDPVEKAGLSQLMFASLGDSAATVSVASGVCYCCKTALTTAADGRVFAAWRHVFPGNQRDIAFAASRDGGATFSAPVRVSDDHWQFDGCPENGPAVAVDQARHVHVVWSTPLDGTLGSPMALYHSMWTDGGAFTPRTRVPSQGPAVHARAVAAPDGSLLIAWEERRGSARAVKLARATFSGDHVAFQDIPIAGVSDGGYPALAITSTGAVVAWVNWSTHDATINVMRVPAR